MTKDDILTVDCFIHSNASYIVQKSWEICKKKLETTHNNECAVTPTDSPKLPSFKDILKELNGDKNCGWTDTDIIPVIDAIKKLGNFA